MPEDWITSEAAKVTGQFLSCLLVVSLDFGGLIDSYVNRYIIVFQAILRQKQSELKGLEKREAALFYNAKARLRYQQRQTSQHPQSQTLTASPSISHCDTRSIASTDSNSSVDTVPSTTESFSRLTMTPKSNSSEQETSFITENNNYRLAPGKKQLDVRPKTTALRCQQSYNNIDPIPRNGSPSMTRAIKTKMTST